MSGTELEQVSTVKYLGTTLEDSSASKKKIRFRIEQTQAALIEMKSLR